MTLTAAEELVVARRASAAGLINRAHQGFSRAARSAALSDGDRFTHGTVLARLGRHDEAITRFDQVRAPARRAEARYQRALGSYCAGEMGPVDDPGAPQDALSGGAGWHIMVTVLSQ